MCGFSLNPPPPAPLSPSLSLSPELRILEWLGMVLLHSSVPEVFGYEILVEKNIDTHSTEKYLLQKSCIGLRRLMHEPSFVSFALPSLVVFM